MKIFNDKQKVARKLLVAFLCIAMVSVGQVPASASGATLDVANTALNFNEVGGVIQADGIGSGSLDIGADLTSSNHNTILSYSDVLSGVDAKVTFLNSTGLTRIDKFDDATSDPGENRFINTDITWDASNQDRFVEFKVEFLVSGTNNPVTLQNLKVSAYDIDNAQTYSITNATSYELATQTVIRESRVGASTLEFFTSNLGTSGSVGSAPLARSSFSQGRVTTNFDSVSTFNFRFGLSKERSGTAGASYSLDFGPGLSWGTGVTGGVRAIDVPVNRLFSAAPVPSDMVIFDANGGTGSMANQRATAATALTANSFSRTGFTFGGWTTTANGTVAAYADGASFPFTAGTATVALFALWVASPGPSSTVVFDANGGSGAMSAQVASTATSLTANTFVRAGHSFAGWNTAADGSGTAYADGATFPFASSATLFAQWTVIPSVASTVTFDANGGSGTMTAQVASTATSLTANTFVRAGHVFAGWNTAADGSGSAYADGASFPFSSNATLFAQWEEVTGVNLFSGPILMSDSIIPEQRLTEVVVEGKRLDRIISASVNKSAVNVRRISATAIGLTFPALPVGVYNVAYALTSGGTMTHTAGLRVVPLPDARVLFDANGGTGVMPAQAASTATNLAANTFARAGHVFAGWNTAANGSGIAYADRASFPFAAGASSTTLFAQWTVAPAPRSTVTFAANGGSGVMAAQVASSATNLNSNTFVRTGHVFAGWNTLANGSGTSYADGASFPFASSETLYAQWTVVPVTNPGTRFNAQMLFANYRGDRNPVTSRDRAAITAFISQYKGIVDVRCVGSTSGIPAKKTDPALARARAVNACDIVKALVPNARITIETSTGKGIGQRFRSVTIFISGTN